MSKNKDVTQSNTAELRDEDLNRVVGGLRPTTDDDDDLDELEPQR